jgi:hypothetical protein
METAFWIILCIIVCFAAGFYIRRLTDSNATLNKTVANLKIVADNKDAVIKSLKDILKAHNIDLGNIIPIHTNRIEEIVTKLREIRNYSTDTPLEVYHRICDLEKELLTLAMTMEKETQTNRA